MYPIIDCIERGRKITVDLKMLLLIKYAQCYKFDLVQKSCRSIRNRYVQIYLIIVKEVIVID